MEDTNQINKESWNAYQEDYFKFQLMARPDYFEFFSSGGVDWQGEEHMINTRASVNKHFIRYLTCIRENGNYIDIQRILTLFIFGTR